MNSQRVTKVILFLIKYLNKNLRQNKVRSPFPKQNNAPDKFKMSLI